MKWILPKILCEITRAPRYKPDIEWSNLVVYNAFRVYEAIFWRRVGIKAEASTAIDFDGNVTRKFFTLEAKLCHIEVLVREWIAQLKRIRVVHPQMVTTTGVRLQLPYSFAIAYDATAITTFGASPKTVSHTVTGSNTLLHGTAVDLNNVVNSFTYNSVSLTRINESSYPGTRYGVASYYLIAPSSGANTLSAGTSSGNLGAACISFSGAKQSAQPDSSGTQNETSQVSTATLTTTVVAADSMIVGTLCDEEGVGGTAGTNTTRAQRSDQGLTYGYSTATVGTGNQSIVFTFSPTIIYGSAYASFAPAGGGGGGAVVVVPTLPFLGAN
jgi:hypothetical protein